MAEDQGKQEEEKFDFSREGEALGYVSLDQARVMAMRTASETPGAYGSAYRDVPMAFEVVEAEETEDHYVISITIPISQSTPKTAVLVGGGPGYGGRQES